MGNDRNSIIRYVGVDNPSATLFEAQYALTHGMSYNSYVLLGDDAAILDTVDAPLCSRWLANVEAALGVREPRYLVVHHMEPDHSGSIAAAMNRWQQLTLVISAKGSEMLAGFFPDYGWSDRVMTVREGDTLALGGATLRFVAAPMVHWPEVMVSYFEEEKVFFSADAFGKFGSLQYADDWMQEAQRYYINIVGKYGAQVQALLRKVAPLSIEAVAPLHGPVLRGAEMARALELYDKWSSYRPVKRGVLVAYASIYGGTAQVAVSLADRLRRMSGVGEVYTADLTRCDQAQAVAKAFEYDAMVVASPTYDAAIFPAVHDFLYHLTIKNYRHRVVGLIENGSWAPTAARRMKAMLEVLPGITFAGDPVTVRSRPDSSTLVQIEDLARAIAERQ